MTTIIATAPLVMSAVPLMRMGEFETDP